MEVVNLKPFFRVPPSSHLHQNPTRSRSRLLSYHSGSKPSPTSISFDSSARRAPPTLPARSVSSSPHVNPFCLLLPILHSFCGFVLSRLSQVRPWLHGGLDGREGEDGYLCCGGIGTLLMSTTAAVSKARVSPFLWTLAGNPTFVSGLVAWSLAQTMKMFLNFFVERRWDLGMLFTSGGMPSSHSALCTALTASVALNHGVSDSLFPVCLGFSLIVMYDAIGVRRHAGMQAEPCTTACRCCLLASDRQTLAAAPFFLCQQRSTVVGRRRYRLQPCCSVLLLRLLPTARCRCQSSAPLLSSPSRPRKPPLPLLPALIATSPVTTVAFTRCRGPSARPCCQPCDRQRSVQLQPHDHLSAIAESGAVLCFSFASPSSLLLLLPPTAASVANVPPPVTVVPPSLAAAAASNRALCRCRALLPLLHLLAAPVAPPCSSTGCRSNRCPSPPATSVPPCHCRRPPSSSSSVLNKIIEDLFQGHPISERKLKELLGHTPSQVFAGAVLGILVACICCQGSVAPI
ncbi:hypothetical protein BHM03_00041301 [Ensete ventricosum]|nr:hypothetical protein BHM03_00041301 [Ensete ventricosum]